MSGQVPGQWATQRAAAATSAETGANYYAPRPRKEEVVDGSDDSADSESESLSDEEDEQSWITWFCSLKGNEFFVEVDEEYIEDGFNLCGLRQYVPMYDQALDMILDHEPPEDQYCDDHQELVESSAEMLYGLVHARFILTSRGMAAMREKFKNADFGRCPRVFCQGQPVLPCGQSDLLRQNTVKIFCPKCGDLYYPKSKYTGLHMDGAYFGTTFSHLFLLTYNDQKPERNEQVYTPRIYGFKIYGGTGSKAAPKADSRGQGAGAAATGAAATGAAVGTGSGFGEGRSPSCVGVEFAQGAGAAQAGAVAVAQDDRAID